MLHTDSGLVSEYDGVLLILCDFLLHLLRIEKLMALDAARIGPRNDRFRLRFPSLRENDCSLSGQALLLGGPCLNHGDHVRPIRVGDPHNFVVEIIDDLEQIGPSGQYVSRNLNRLAEGKQGSLIPFICTYNRQDDQECKQECNGDKISDDSNFLHNSSFLSYPGRLIDWFFRYCFFVTSTLAVTSKTLKSRGRMSTACQKLC